jgi:hypothetical protein
MIARTKTSKGLRILLWLAFSVGFSLVPLFINYTIAHGKHDFRWTLVVNRGELFLICVALCADLVGRMWGQRGQRGYSRYTTTLCFIVCLYVLFASSIVFAMAAPSLDAGNRFADSEATESLIFFVATIIAGLGVVLAED